MSFFDAIVRSIRVEDDDTFSASVAATIAHRSVARETGRLSLNLSAAPDATVG